MAKDQFPDLETALQGTHVYNPRAVERIAGSTDRCKAIQDNLAIACYEETKLPAIVKGVIAAHLDGCPDCTKNYAVVTQLDRAISYYQDNESLTAERRRAMLLHLNACDGCGTSYREYVKTMNVARQIYGIPPKRNV